MGSKILYYLIILPISRMPYFMLYGFSNFMYYLMFYVIGYRKKVVAKNLSLTFPDKSEPEIKQISKKFYRHFLDLVLESLKNFSVSEKNAVERMVCKNPELIDQYFKQNKSVVICGGHYNNWELWAVSVGSQVKHQVLGIYKRLSNAFFDEKMRETRGRFGLELVSTREVKEVFAEKKDQIIAPVFAVDQSPADPKKSLWIKFLGRETACYYGAEKYAKENDFPVIFCKIDKVKRGHYEFEFEVISDDPQKEEYGDIIKKSHRILEEQILNSPEYWLWTHKRWKHNRPEGVEMI